MGGLAYDLDENDDIGFVHQVRPIVAGVLRTVEAAEVYVVKIDNWFGDRWLGFSHKLLGAAGVSYRETLRVPPFVPARVASQRFFRRGADGGYVEEDSQLSLHVDQTSEGNAQRQMAAVCPRAAVFWWSGSTRANQRGSLMAYFPTVVRDREAIPAGGHGGWYADFKKVREWSVGKTRRTTAQELSTFAAPAA